MRTIKEIQREVEVDSRLIDAAPDLLKAVKDVLRIDRGLSAWSKETLRDAIAKAEKTE